MNDTLKNIVEGHLLRGQILLDAKEDLRGNYLRIIVDSEKDITLNDTALLTKALRDSTEIDSMYPNGYRLEVSTPGLDNSLKLPFQYKKNINRSLTVSYLENKIEKKITGKLVNVYERNIELISSSKSIILDYEQIVDAKVNVSFK